jgi:hypothetical protein
VGDRITYVGLDVHKEGIVVAVAEGGIRGEVREYGRIANTPAALDRLVRKLDREGARLRFCYEAGPCGYMASNVACQGAGTTALRSLRRLSRNGRATGLRRIGGMRPVWRGCTGRAN